VAWHLPDIVRSVANRIQGVPYDPGGPWIDDQHCSPGVKPHAAELGRIIRASFPWVRSIGALHCTRLSATSDQMSLHGAGRALDVMVPVLGGPEGESLANWLVENAKELGVQLVIWNRSNWQANLPPRARFGPYTGRSPHTNHVHVEVTATPGRALLDPSVPLTRPRAGRGDSQGMAGLVVFGLILLLIAKRR